MKGFLEYYIRSALPFVTGLAFGVGSGSLDVPLVLKVVFGAALVVVGPLLIESVLTLIVEALRGPDTVKARGIALEPPEFRIRRRF